jgi:hypothetical protein
MVGPNKILTVSYGTFSCTLEGFDDPFSTMKAIAEYFRDLAAEDRYFGAEPPTPDAEMLHRIAEREIQRRVEARIQDGGVVLRPQIEAAAAAPAAPVAPVAAPAAVARPLAAEADAASAISERLQRIRAAVARSTTDTAPSPSQAEAEAARIAAEAAERARIDAEAEAEAARITAATEAARIAAEAAERARIDAEAEAEAARIAAATEAARIAAEAETARIDAEATRLEAEAAARAEAPVETPVETPAEAPTQPEEAQRVPRRVVVVRSARPVEVNAPADTVPDVASQDWAPQAFQPAPQPPADAAVAPTAERPDMTGELADEVAAEATPDTAPRAPAAADLADEDDDLDAAEEERRWAEAAARIAAAAAAAQPEPQPESEPQPEPAAQPAPELTPETRALADLVESQRQAILREVSSDQAVARLISQTEAQLSDADAQRRQSTFSHLKGAVLAVRAEQEATGAIPGAISDAPDMARYRADLEQSVRSTAEAGDGPRRPVRPAGGRIDRPAATQPPLVLVSEQRIDRPANAEIVVPRRIATGATALDDLFDEAAPIRAPLGKAFVDFVAPLQLTTVAEMTEAAAAYITYVTGHEDFSRPTVMKLVMSTEAPMTRSRENLLRAFGMLMRQGVLRRSRRGQFELSDTSGFADHARRFAAH